MKLKTVWEHIYQDMIRLNSYSLDNNKQTDKLSFLRKVSLIFRPELLCLILYRFSHFCFINKKNFLADFFYRLNIFLLSIDISPDSEIGDACLIIHPSATIINGHIGTHATLTTRIIILPEFRNNRWSNKPQLGNNVTIGAQCLITGDIKIADNVTIAPYCHINESITEANILVSCTHNKIRYSTNKKMNPI